MTGDAGTKTSCFDSGPVTSWTVVSAIVIGERPCRARYARIRGEGARRRVSSISSFEFEGVEE